MMTSLRGEVVFGKDERAVISELLRLELGYLARGLLRMAYDSE